jgi:hypothetical protein
MIDAQLNQVKTSSRNKKIAAAHKFLICEHTSVAFSQTAGE